MKYRGYTINHSIAEGYTTNGTAGYATLDEVRREIDRLNAEDIRNNPDYPFDDTPSLGEPRQ